MASKLSASSRNSSLRPGSRIRWESDPVRGRAGGVGDAGQGGEHAAGEQPPSHETEHQQERQHEGRESERSRAEGRTWLRTTKITPGSRGDHAVRHVAQEEHPHGDEQHGAGDHEEAGVAEGELEANAQTGARSTVFSLTPGASGGCRCGSRRRPRWR